MPYIVCPIPKQENDTELTTTSKVKHLVSEIIQWNELDNRVPDNWLKELERLVNEL